MLTYFYDTIAQSGVNQTGKTCLKKKIHKENAEAFSMTIHIKKTSEIKYKDYNLVPLKNSVIIDKYITKECEEKGQDLCRPRNSLSQIDLILATEV